MTNRRNKMTLHIKVLENLSLTVPVLRKSAHGQSTFLVDIDDHAARLVRPAQEVFLISDNYRPLKVDQKSTIQSVRKDNNGVIVTITKKLII
jgi:hypothetical protein